ncbi:AMP-binding protein [Lutimonas saemankumensis]|uniref:AMP-binding protein n=1 Tax=Lutimonas saemankumensis TaxID=483016 RepID=UPI001CD1C62B|nr:AMP-binding protein [Lutimonas saemankumensis]MCA0931500.1 AMP-binding protein [Lutimonas saemankumensis]
MKQFKTPLEAFLYWEEACPDQIFLKQFHKGKKDTWSFKQSGQEIRKMAAAIAKKNFPPQSNIALLSRNCDYWVLADLAIMMSGHVSVPLYPTLNEESLQPVVEHSESKMVIICKLDDWDSQKGAFKNIPKISVEKYGIIEEETWESLTGLNEPLKDVQLPNPKDLITIIYTSGTTGNPKGVMHSHENFANAAYNLFRTLSVVEHPSYFSYLPLSHIAERVGLETSAIYMGGNLSFPDSLETFPQDLEATQPDLFFAVPRIYAKFREKILEGLPQKRLNVVLNIPILNNVLKKKIKSKLGLSKAKYIASGAAPLSVNIMKWYKKLGIEIIQAYGMTEDCIISHCNLPGRNKIGTVGKFTHGAQAKLSEIGEICVKNNSLMLGYFKNPEETAKSFDKDGYLRTGDIGEYDHDGFLTITGRAKDQFKTDKGKYISPAPIELELSKNTDIGQVCIVGMGIPQPIMLVIPSELGKIKSKSELNESLLQSILEINPQLEKHEKIEKAVIMKEDWSVENGLLTPTLKIKRTQVEKIHLPMYRSWFDAEERIIYE